MSGDGSGSVFFHHGAPGGDVRAGAAAVRLVVSVTVARRLSEGARRALTVCHLCLALRPWVGGLSSTQLLWYPALVEGHARTFVGLQRICPCQKKNPDLSASDVGLDFDFVRKIARIVAAAG